jgi:hypothetical protein
MSTTSSGYDAQHAGNRVQLHIKFSGNPNDWQDFDFCFKLYVNSRGLPQLLVSPLAVLCQAIRDDNKSTKKGPALQAEKKTLVEQLQKNSSSVLLTLINALNSITRAEVINCPTQDVFSIYTLLKNSNEGKTNITKFHLLHQLQTLSLSHAIQSNPQYDVTTLINHVSSLVSRLLQKGTVIDADMKLMFLLQSIDLPSYAITKTSFHMQPPNLQTWTTLTDSLNLCKENIRFSSNTRTLSPPKPTGSKAFLTTNSKRDTSQVKCFGCQKLGHYRNKCPSSSTTSTFQRSSITCNYCRKPGHVIADCRKKKYSDSKRFNPSPPSTSTSLTATTNVPETHPKTYPVFGLFGGLPINPPPVPYSQALPPVTSRTASMNIRTIIDSGCSDHLICPEQEKQNIRLLQSPLSLITAGRPEHLFHQADYSLLTYHDDPNLPNRLKITNALVCPSLNHMNLISVSRLQTKGIRVIFQGNYVLLERKLFPDAEQFTILAVGILDVDNLYVLQNIPTFPAAQVFSNSALFTQTRNIPPVDFQTWHLRLGHRSDNLLVSLEKKQLLKFSETPKSSRSCRVCRITKSHRAPHLKLNLSPPRKTLPGEKWHGDLQGPLHTQTLGQKRWVLLFTDDASRLGVIFLLRFKSEQTSSFKILCALSQRQMNQPIKVFRSDGEWISNEFKDFIREQGIVHEKTTAHTPISNPFAESNGGSLTQTARCLLSQSGLPPQFAGEAFMTSNYIRNRIPHSSLQGKSPLSIVDSTPSCDISHFRAFGCLCYLHILDKKARGKVGMRAKPCVFVGYSVGSNITQRSYRVYCRAEAQVYDSLDVSFDETRRGWITTSNDPPTLLPALFSQDALTPLLDLHSEQSQTANTGDSLTHTDSTQQTLAVVSPPPSISDSTTPESSRPTDIDYQPPLSTRPKRSYTPSLEGLESLSNLGLVLTHTGSTTCLLSISAFLGRTSTSQSTELTDPWAEAKEKELASLNKNMVYTVVDATDISPSSIVGSRWVLTDKLAFDGTLIKKKARLVAQGYSQKPGVNYDITSIYSPTVSDKTIKIVLSLAVHFPTSKLQHLDVETAFLNAPLNETIYMRPPKDLVLPGQLWKLLKGVYGLKQANRLWNRYIQKGLEALGYTQTKTDSCLFYKPCSSNSKLPNVIALHVDDFIFLYHSLADLQFLLNGLAPICVVKDLGPLKWILGMSIDFTPGESLKISQSLYTQKILSRFGFSNCRPSRSPCVVKSSTFRSAPIQPNSLAENFSLYEIVGMLIWLMRISRPDICFAVSKLAQDCSNPTPESFTAAGRLLRYLASTPSYGLTYSSPDRLHSHLGPKLHGYVDADWAGDIADRKSQTGYLCFLNDSLISWSSKKQSTVALSTTESEIIAASSAVCELRWFQHLLTEIKFPTILPIVLQEDNQAAIILSQNGVISKRCKHIDIRHASLQEWTEKGVISLVKVASRDNLADINTKALPIVTFQNLAARIMSKMQ